MQESRVNDKKMNKFCLKTYKLIDFITEILIERSFLQFDDLIEEINKINFIQNFKNN